MSRPLAVRILAVTVLVLGSGFVTQQVARYPGMEHEGKAFDIKQVVPGVYHALGTGAMSVGANVVIVEGDRDVLLVDANASPAAAAVLLEELRAITDKPVRTVVNTHYHFDHAHGNQVYGPNVEIVGTEYTRQALASGRSQNDRAYNSFVRTIPDRITQLEGQIARATDAAERRSLEEQLAAQRTYKAATDAVVPTPSTVTVSDELTLWRGGRPIRIMFVGRSHTGGDLVVHLPSDRVLITGDMLSTGVPFMGDGYVPEWPATLERLKGLEFDWIVPGHGPAFQDRAKIDQLQSYMRDFWTRAREMHQAGVPVAEAAARIDMRDHAADFPAIRAAGVQAQAVQRAYELLEGGS
jgi:glyoxylase-like metal-dependent hydrolase (beta-lactamase superfamily II)